VFGGTLNLTPFLTVLAVWCISINQKGVGLMQSNAVALRVKAKGHQNLITSEVHHNTCSYQVTAIYGQSFLFSFCASSSGVVVNFCLGERLPHLPFPSLPHLVERRSPQMYLRGRCSPTTTPLASRQTHGLTD